MAQEDPTRPKLSHSEENVSDLLDDLKILRVPSTEYGSDLNSMVKAREQRIKELKKANGTLKKV